jgi:hypothetical protein
LGKPLDGNGEGYLNRVNHARLDHKKPRRPFDEAGFGALDLLLEGELGYLEFVLDGEGLEVALVATPRI